MSRSYRHNNIVANTCTGYDRSEKKDKQIANQKLRSKTKQILSQKQISYDDINLPVLKEVSDPWSWIKDGKSKVSIPCKDSSFHFTKSGKLRK